MRALIIAYHYPPEMSGGTARPTLLERYLVERGVEVTVVAPQQRAKGVAGGRFWPLVPSHKRTSVTDGAPPKRGSLFRMAAMAADAILIPDRTAGWGKKAGRMMVDRFGDEAPDIVVTTSPPESVHLAGLIAKKAWPGCRWVADIRDGWSVEPLRPQINWPVRGWLERRVERKVYATADAVAFVSRMTLERTATLYPKEADRFLHWVTGYEPFTGTPEEKNDDRFTLTYAGRFTGSHATRTPVGLAEGIAIALTRRPTLAESFQLRLIGTFTDEERTTLTAGPLANLVTIEPPVAQDLLPPLLAAADALLLVTAPGHLTAVPRKLYDYLGVRRPILALTGRSEAARIVEEIDAGLVAPADKPEEIAEALLHMIDAKEDRFGFVGVGRYRADEAADRFFDTIGVSFPEPPGQARP